MKGLSAIFRDFFASASKIFNLAGGILWSLDTFLIFPNSLTCLKSFGNSQDNSLHHVYK